MITFFQAWRRFNQAFRLNNICAGTRAIGYTLLAIFDENRMPPQIQISDSTLAGICGLKDRKAVMKARAELKELGLLDNFTKPPRAPIYFNLCALNEQSSGQSSGQPSGQPEKIPNNTRAPLPSYLPTTTPIEEIWQEETGFKIQGAAAERLKDEEQRHGREKILTVIRKSVASSQGKTSFNYFLKILENMSRGNDNFKRTYEDVDTTWLDD